MKPLFFKMAIALTIVIFANHVLMALSVFTGNVITIWVSCLVFEMVLTIPVLYMSYRFYFYKKARLLFYLSIPATAVGLINYYDSILFALDPFATADRDWVSYMAYGMALIASASVFFTPLRKENLFVISAIANAILSIVGIVALITGDLLISALVYYVSSLVQLIWILIFYREMRKGINDEILDQ